MIEAYVATLLGVIFGATGGRLIADGVRDLQR